MRERFLSKHEAELALRFETKPRGNERSYEIAQVPYAVYARKAVDAAALPWIGLAEETGSYAPERWLNEAVKEDSERISLQANDAGFLYRAACAGVGKGLLPEALAEHDPALVRLSGPEPDMVRQLRILVHPECVMETVQAADFDGSTEFIIRTVNEAPAGSKWAVGTEISLVNRIAQENPDKLVFCLDSVVCPCSTMYRTHPAYLLWSMDTLLQGEVNNQITVDEETAHYARIALDRMLHEV